MYYTGSHTRARFFLPFLEKLDIINVMRLWGSEAERVFFYHLKFLAL